MTGMKLFVNSSKAYFPKALQHFGSLSTYCNVKLTRSESPIKIHIFLEPSIHGSIQLVSVNESRNVEVDGGDLFHARLLDAYTLELQVKKEATSNISCLSEPVVIRAPFKTLRKVDYCVDSTSLSGS